MQDKTEAITLTYSTLFAIQQMQGWVNQLGEKTLDPISCEVKWVEEGGFKEYFIEMGFGAKCPAFHASPYKIWAEFKIEKDNKNEWQLVHDSMVKLGCSMFGGNIEYQYYQGRLFDCPHKSLRAIAASIKVYEKGTN